MPAGAWPGKRPCPVVASDLSSRTSPSWEVYHANTGQIRKNITFYSDFSASSIGERRAAAVATEDDAIPVTATRASRTPNEATGT